MEPFPSFQWWRSLFHYYSSLIILVEIWKEKKFNGKLWITLWNQNPQDLCGRIWRRAFGYSVWWHEMKMAAQRSSKSPPGIIRPPRKNPSAAFLKGSVYAHTNLQMPTGTHRKASCPKLTEGEWKCSDRLVWCQALISLFGWWVDETNFWGHRGNRCSSGPSTVSGSCVGVGWCSHTWIIWVLACGKINSSKDKNQLNNTQFSSVMSGQEGKILGRHKEWLKWFYKEQQSLGQIGSFFIATKPFIPWRPLKQYQPIALIIELTNILPS